MRPALPDTTTLRGAILTVALTAALTATPSPAAPKAKAAVPKLAAPDVCDYVLARLYEATLALQDAPATSFVLASYNADRGASLYSYTQPTWTARFIPSRNQYLIAELMLDGDSVAPAYRSGRTFLRGLMPPARNGASQAQCLGHAMTVTWENGKVAWVTIKANYID